MARVGPQRHKKKKRFNENLYECHAAGNISVILL